MEKLSLNGLWNIRSTDGHYELTSDVPGSLFYALEKEGQLGEGLFYRENNRAALEIADRDFLWERSFTVDGGFLASEEIHLVAEGLDTLGEITINGHAVGSTDNMHRTWRFNVAPYLRKGENRIAILFRNSLEYIRKEKERRDLYAADGGGLTSVPGFNMIRKSHCSFGWDWGPMVPDVGIWRDIALVSYGPARLKSIHVTQNHREGGVNLFIKPEIERFEESSLTLRAVITSPDGRTSGFEVDPGGSAYEVAHPRLWWPNGLGEQPLYRLDFFLEEKGRVIDDLSQKIGLRTLTIEQKKDQWGETFNFNCNGLSIFARGGNYIPEDIYLNRLGPYGTEQLLEDCRSANFNCIRVWGGGVYPSDNFFDLCDEKGLIVWEDLMFACAAYDVSNDHFLENIMEEVRDNLLRIRHHASLGLICGNNEMEMAFEDWGINPTGLMRTEYLKQYQFIFPSIASEICPELFYWPASPSSGGDFEDPNDPDRGDCHFWEVWHGNKDFSEFKNHYFRFMSEFGFESFPSMKTLKSFTEPEDRNIFSPVMEEHQKCIGGNGKILTYISKYFQYPKDFSSLVYVSQLSQMEAITTGIKHWRRNRGRCMGSTYWQLNDNWPVASWSSIDYYGRWKALHYGARRAYDNILLSLDGNDHAVEIHLSNESSAITEGTVSWKLFSLKGDLLDSGSCAASVPPFSSRMIEKRDFTSDTSKKKDRDVYLSVSFTDSRGRIFRDFHNFAPFKYLNLLAPEIRTEITEREDTFEIELVSRHPALHVEIDFEASDAVLSDNYFHLDGGIPCRVTLPRGKYTLEELAEEIRVRSLFDSY
ncbi:MAG: glycoside hydrolase family 2 protein [Spirochaetales bacterium]|nr:glycoside hydrolase family 2 protein [Spirochaetales bacterium]